jgi:hypothetical protein
MYRQMPKVTYYKCRKERIKKMEEKDVRKWIISPKDYGFGEEEISGGKKY